MIRRQPDHGLSRCTSDNWTHTHMCWTHMPRSVSKICVFARFAAGLRRNRRSVQPWDAPNHPDLRMDDSRRLCRSWNAMPVPCVAAVPFARRFAGMPGGAGRDRRASTNAAFWLMFQNVLGRHVCVMVTTLGHALGDAQNVVCRSAQHRMQTMRIGKQRNPRVNALVHHFGMQSGKPLVGVFRMQTQRGPASRLITDSVCPTRWTGAERHVRGVNAQFDASRGQQTACAGVNHRSCCFF